MGPPLRPASSLPWAISAYRPTPDVGRRLPGSPRVVEGPRRSWQFSMLEFCLDRRDGGVQERVDSDNSTMGDFCLDRCGWFWERVAFKRFLVLFVLDPPVRREWRWTGAIKIKICCFSVVSCVFSCQALSP